MVKRFKTTILICLLFTGMGFLGMFVLSNAKHTKVSQQESVPLVTASELEEENVVSPDGKYELNMKSSATKSAISYEFTIIDNTSDAKHKIYSSIIPENQTLSIPFNTFSPDNKLVFLKEVSMGRGSYMVFSSSGKPMLTEGSQLEVSSLFYAKYSSYKITDITGWAAPTLLIVNTDKISGGEGPSFWFDVGTKDFIRLSTRFN